MLLAEGFEEIEAVFPIDVLRRCGVEVQTVGLSEYVKGSNGITIKPDIQIDQIANEGIKMLILPGGPGRTNILKSDKAMNFVRVCCENQTPIAAICGAPEILNEIGHLKGKNFTCYPSLEVNLDGVYVNTPVITDGNLITSQGAGTSEHFAFAIAEFLCGKEKSDEIRKRMICQN
jgi:4-methyl-5(b-hydroxyethyl)-thiazole monophosphate biosynthesis